MLPRFRQFISENIADRNVRIVSAPKNRKSLHGKPPSAYGFRCDHPLSGRKISDGQIVGGLNCTPITLDAQTSGTTDVAGIAELPFSFTLGT